MLYNDLHVQQALALIRQHQELTEVLKIQLHVTKDQDAEGAPLTIDPVVQVVIKPVDKGRGVFQLQYQVREVIPLMLCWPWALIPRKPTQGYPGISSQLWG